MIIGHEMAHAILGNAAENISRTKYIEACLLLPMCILWTFIPSDGIAFITHWFLSKMVDIFVDLPFSRECESEADDFGIMLAAKACFDVREAPALWIQMELADIDDPQDDTEYLQEFLGYLSTHPTHQDRTHRLQSTMEYAIELRKRCGCCDLDPNSDPLKIALSRKSSWTLEDSIEREKEKILNRVGFSGVELIKPSLQ